MKMYDMGMMEVVNRAYGRRAGMVDNQRHHMMGCIHRDIHTYLYGLCHGGERYRCFATITYDNIEIKWTID
jgi:hypothetical protein